jgi:hypothetical protein
MLPFEGTLLNRATITGNWHYHPSVHQTKACKSLSYTDKEDNLVELCTSFVYPNLWINKVQKWQLTRRYPKRALHDDFAKKLGLKEYQTQPLYFVYKGNSEYNAVGHLAYLNYLQVYFNVQA